MAASPKMEPPGLQVLIAGGGIGGLATALALRSSGHRVSIYEQSFITDTTGAGIAIFPNGVTSLRDLGLDLKQIHATRIEKVTSSHIEQDGSVDTITRDLRKKNWLWHMAAYPDLLASLWEAVMDPERPGPQAKIYSSKTILRVDTERAVLYFSDGSEAHGDVIIGADGVHSVCRSALPSGVTKQFRLERGVFRAMVRRDKLADDPLTLHFVEDRGHAHYYSYRDKSLSVYPASNHQAVCVKLIYDDSRAAENITRDWRDRPKKSKLMHIASDLPKECIALLDKINDGELQGLPIWDMDPLEVYHANRMVLMGDAAHPMPPYCGQRTAMALEDAVALGILLERGLDRRAIDERLKIFSRTRHERITAIHSSMRMLKDSDIWGNGSGFDTMTFRTYVVDHNERESMKKALQTWKLNQSLKMPPKILTANLITTQDMPAAVGARIPSSNGEGHDKRKPWYGSVFSKSRSASPAPAGQRKARKALFAF